MSVCAPAWLLAFVGLLLAGPHVIKALQAGNGLLPWNR